MFGAPWSNPLKGISKPCGSCGPQGASRCWECGGWVGVNLYTICVIIYVSVKLLSCQPSDCSHISNCMARLAGKGVNTFPSSICDRWSLFLALLTRGHFTVVSDRPSPLPAIYNPKLFSVFLLFTYILKSCFHSV